jgi:hypothetical protein
LIHDRLIEEVMLRGVPAEWYESETNVEQLDIIQKRDYTIRKLRYEIVPGLWAGALLYEPKDIDSKAPGMLNPNGHDRANGMFSDYKQKRCLNLVKRGIVTLNLEWIGMGQLNSSGFTHDNLAYLDLCGVSGVSVFYLSLVRGLDILCGHAMVDPSRIGVTGLSGGGWQTIIISALDNRVKLTVPNAGYIGFARRIEWPRDVGDLEQNPVDMGLIADYTHLTAMLAPRPALLIYNIEDDCCFQGYRAKPSVYNPVVPLYEMYGAPDRFAFHLNFDPGTHNYEQDNREALYRFVNEHFFPNTQISSDEIPVDGDILSRNRLKIVYPPDNLNLISLAETIISDVPKESIPDNAVERESWATRTQKALAEVVRVPQDYSISDDAIIKVNHLPMPIDNAEYTTYRMNIGGKWTVPATVYTPENIETPAGITFVLADRGMLQKRIEIRNAINNGNIAVAVDILFTGECLPQSESTTYRLAMLMNAMGLRPLGVQIGQLKAVITHFENKYPGIPVSVKCEGRVSSFAALTAAALGEIPVQRVEFRHGISSLKDLLQNRIEFRHVPSLFTWGFLEYADIPELYELARNSEIEVVSQTE